MRIFVYGTLKKNYSNHFLLKKAKFLGYAKTYFKYPLINVTKEYPYLCDKKGLGYRISGEVYYINYKILKQLDILEEYPNYYKRKIIKINLNNKIIFAITYFKKNCTYLKKYKFLERF